MTALRLHWFAWNGGRPPVRVGTGEFDVVEQSSQGRPVEWNRRKGHEFAHEYLKRDEGQSFGK